MANSNNINEAASLAQKIVALQMLNAMPVQPSRMSRKLMDDMTVRGLLTFKRERQLAEAFAFLSSTTKDPACVLAICIEQIQEPSRLAVRIAVNNGSTEEFECALKSILVPLKNANGCDEITLEQTRDKFLAAIVEQHQNRILTRLRSKHASQEGQWVMKKSSKLGFCALIEVALAQKEFETASALRDGLIELADLCNRLDTLSKSEACSQKGRTTMARILRVAHAAYKEPNFGALKTTIMDEFEESQIELLERTFRRFSYYISVSDFLIRMAHQSPLFSHYSILKTSLKPVKLGTKPLYAPLHRMSKDIRRNDKRPPEDIVKINALEYVAQEAGNKHAVHAEMQLLLHYEAHPIKIMPRIICSNKEACYLCALFLDTHGKFRCIGSHGRVYAKWGVPPVLFNRTHPRSPKLFHITEQFSKRVDKILKKQVSSPMKPFPMPYESAIFETPPYTGTDLSVGSLKHDVPETKKSALREDLTATLQESESEDDASDILCPSDLTATPSNRIDVTPQETSAETRASHHEAVMHVLKQEQATWQCMSDKGAEFSWHGPGLHLTVVNEEQRTDSPVQTREDWLCISHARDSPNAVSSKRYTIDISSLAPGEEVSLDLFEKGRPKVLTLLSRTGTTTLVACTGSAHGRD